MPARQPIEQDKLSVLCDGDLYVFGDSTIEVWPDDLPLDHPFVRVSDNSKSNQILSSESND